MIEQRPPIEIMVYGPDEKENEVIAAFIGKLLGSKCYDVAQHDSRASRLVGCIAAEMRRRLPLKVFSVGGPDYAAAIANALEVVKGNLHYAWLRPLLRESGHEV